MKGKEQQLASEIKKLHYELSFEHDLSTTRLIKIEDSQNSWEIAKKNVGFNLENTK